MTTTEIQPALTASEWAEEFVRTGENEHEARDNGDVTFDRDGTVTTDLPQALYDRHVNTPDGALLTQALAAVFLYGQPFGFAHEDVAMLRDLASTIDAHGDAIGSEWVGEILGPLRLLTARIEALLPTDQG